MLCAPRAANKTTNAIAVHFFILKILSSTIFVGERSRARTHLQLSAAVFVGSGKIARLGQTKSEAVAQIARVSCGFREAMIYSGHEKDQGMGFGDGDSGNSGGVQHSSNHGTEATQPRFDGP